MRVVSVILRSRGLKKAYTKNKPEINVTTGDRQPGGLSTIVWNTDRLVRRPPLHLDLSTPDPIVFQQPLQEPRMVGCTRHDLVRPRYSFVRFSHPSYMRVNLVRRSFVQLRHRVGASEKLEQEDGGVGSHDSDGLLRMSEHTCCSELVHNDLEDLDRRVVTSTERLEIEVVYREGSRHGVLEPEAIEEESNV